MFKKHIIHASQPTEQALTPTQVIKAYGVPTGVDVSKRTVCVLELGGAVSTLDLFLFCKKNGYKTPQLSTVFVDGTTQTNSFD